MTSPTRPTEGTIRRGHVSALCAIVSLGCGAVLTGGATDPASPVSGADVSAPVLFSTDYGLGILGGATNGPDRHAADVDDAYAVSLALRHADVRAIVTTFGNTKARPSADAARRGLAALGLRGADGIVEAGSEGFLDAEPVTFAPPGPPAPVFCVNAGVERMRDVLRASTPASVTLFAIGPFTDIACLQRAYPEAFARLREIIGLAGSFDGRPVLEGKPVVDFNFAMDPTALGETIAQDRIPVTLLLFEVTQTGALENSLLREWATASSPAQRFYARATLPHARYWDAIFPATGGQALFDAHTVYYFVEPAAYECQDAMRATATVGGYPDTNAGTTKNLLTVTLPPYGTAPAAGVVDANGSAVTYTGRVRGCYAFSSPLGERNFVASVQASVSP